MELAELKKLLTNFTLSGRNLGNVENVELNGLDEFDFSKYGFELDTKLHEAIKSLLLKVQNRYLSLYQELKSNDSVKPMEYDDNGKVIIKPNMFFHRAVAKVDILSNISKGGILASEWFGELESEQEGCFCAFLNTTNDPDNAKYFMMQNHNRKMGLPLSSGECVIYFDSEHPAMRKLVEMDYFEYAHLKNSSPEKIPELYSKDTIELLEFIFSMSLCGRNMHDIPDSESSLWKAIPGGIPPQLINGICINSKNLEMNANVETFIELFPNATIFDETKQVLNRNREVNRLIQLDEVSLRDELHTKSLGELSATKKGFENSLGKAKELLTLAREEKLKQQERDGKENER